MKTYASDQLNETHQLIYKGSRLTFCLLLTICLPLIIETSTILGIWLKEVPEGSVVFLRLLLVILIVRQSTSVLVTAVAATGNIKKYEITMGILMLSILPIAYVVLKMGGSPWSAFVVFLVIVIIGYFVSLYIILPQISLSLKDYIRFSIKRCLLVLVLSLIVPLLLKFLLDENLFLSIVNIILSVICTSIISFEFGLEAAERRAVTYKVKSIVSKYSKK